MNYITSCPQCNTHFLISTEHLKAGHGKVQCGNCEHVFNAKNRLKEASEYTETAPEEEQVENIEIPAPTEPPPAETETVSNPFFLEDLTTHPQFNKPQAKISYGLITLSVLLALLAVLQWVYFSRTELAAQFPQYKPYLAQACELLHCKIDLPQHLDLLAIDDSDMQEDQEHKEVINFSSTLFNRAQFAQAYPDIELTLTDANEHAVLRKIIKPADYLGAQGDLETGLPAHDEVRIKLPIHTTDTPVSGYRVQLVY